MTPVGIGGELVIVVLPKYVARKWQARIAPVIGKHDRQVGHGQMDEAKGRPLIVRDRGCEGIESVLHALSLLLGQEARF